MAKYDYTPNKISRMSEKAVRSAYTELRKIANKRAQRMAKAGVESAYSGVYFPTIKELGDLSSIRSALAAVSRQLRDPRSGLAGAKKYNRKMIQTFHEHGYDFINERNLKDFTDFMEWTRARAGANDRVFKSDRAAELYEQAEKQRISTESLKRNYEQYAKDYQERGKIRTQRRREPQRSSDEYRSRFEHAGFRRKK